MVFAVMEDAQTPTNILALLKRDEGNEPGLYYLNDIPHIGVGHNLKDGPPLSALVRNMILADDVAHVIDQLGKRVVGWAALSEVRRAVLISVAFQTGVGGLMQFKNMLLAMSQGAWGSAALELLDSQLAKQNVRRTQTLAKMLDSGEWQ
jgi:lysozyme